MESIHSQIQKQKTKRHKKRLTQDQLKLLETSFNRDNKLRPERKAQLARDLCVPPRQVAIWYQNRRARWKSQTLELDYSALQVKLDSVLDQKRRLEREVWMLRVELQKAQEMLFVMNMNLRAPPVSSLSNSCNDDGSSSLPSEVMNNNTENTEVLQVQELYAFLMGADDQSPKQPK